MQNHFIAKLFDVVLVTFAKSVISFAIAHVFLFVTGLLRCLHSRRHNKLNYHSIILKTNLKLKASEGIIANI